MFSLGCVLSLGSCGTGVLARTEEHNIVEAPRVLRCVVQRRAGASDKQPAARCGAGCPSRPNRPRLADLVGLAQLPRKVHPPEPPRNFPIALALHPCHSRLKVLVALLLPLLLCAGCGEVVAHGPRGPRGKGGGEGGGVELGRRGSDSARAREGATPTLTAAQAAAAVESASVSAAEAWRAAGAGRWEGGAGSGVMRGGRE